MRTSGCFAAAIAVFGLGADAALALPVLETSGTEEGAEKRYPIPQADSVNVDHSASLIVARFHGRVYVFSLACPHQNAPVRWVAKDGRFQCTRHDSRYQADGVHISGRATRNLDRYVIRRDGDSIVVDLQKWVQSDKDPAGWAAAGVAL